PSEYRNTSRRTCNEKEFTTQELEYLQALYDGEIRFTDENVGGLIEGLKGLGVYNKTIIVIIGDHAEEFQEHGGCDHGHSLYDELIHVPMFMRIPSLENTGKISQQVREIDILPTVFDVLDIQYKADGVSLIPLIHGLNKSDLVVFSEAIHPSYAPEQKAVRHKGYKLIYQPPSKREEERWEFYDLQNDVMEQRQIIPEQGIRDELSELLLKFLSETERNQTQSEIEYEGDVEERLKSIGYIV
ncbi:sulfatase, partial [Candidatus Altiarchaeota archaeon]